MDNTGGVQYRYPGDSADNVDAEYCLEICSEIRDKTKKYLLKKE